MRVFVAATFTGDVLRNIIGVDHIECLVRALSSRLGGSDLGKSNKELL